MSIALAMAFAPVYAATPASIYHGCTPISPRFPMPGGTTNGLIVGTNGTSSHIVPVRSAIEAQQWGANVAVWSYIDRAVALGYSSEAQLVGEFAAIGAPIQATTNAQPADILGGPFALDIAGYPFSSNTASPRPAPLTSPTALNRGAVNIPFLPANNSAARTAKLAAISAQLSAGASMLHMDDPRGVVSLAGFTAHISQRDLTSQTADFSATAIAGFPAWLSANTTSAQRVAVGLPSDPTGLDLAAWLETNHSSVLHSVGQTTPALVDGYLFRVSVSTRDQLRSVMRLYSSYLQADQFAWLQQVRTAAGVPFSLNLYAANALAFTTWTVRQTVQPFDFAISEVPPPYWTPLSGYTVGSLDWIAARWAQCAEQHAQMAMADHVGLLCLCEHKPTAPNTAPPRVLKQMLRQSIMQTVMEGHIPVVPIDVFMTPGDPRGQGIDAGFTGGYRFWGSVTDYGDLFAFIRANAHLLQGYDKLATVHLAAHNDSYPFRDGDAAAVVRYDAISARLAELWLRDVPYHLLTVGEASGTLPEVPQTLAETRAPLIIQIQEPGEYMSYTGRLSGSRCRRWSTQACNEAMGYSPVRSVSAYVRATARYNAATQRVSVHLHNYAVNSDGTPAPQTTTLVWNWGRAGVASIVRLGESGGTVDLSSGSASVSLTEYAIVNFAVA